MTSIIVYNKEKGSTHIHFTPLKSLITGIGVISVLVGFIMVGYQFAYFQVRDAIVDKKLVKSWFLETTKHEQALKLAKEKTTYQIETLSEKLGAIQAQMHKINHLGQKLVELANLDKDEFDFNKVHSHPVDILNQDAQLQLLSSLEEKLALRYEQLKLVDELLTERQQYQAMKLEGQVVPIRSGWISSYYGSRKDPFTGKLAWHSGIDFAGKEGQNVSSVASGVVTFAGDHPNYGKLVEISHGNGLTTRYGHNKSLRTQVGDKVEKGQLIATLGNSGRSTGMHVHFEVRKNGKAVDPGHYFPNLVKGKVETLLSENLSSLENDQSEHL